jgi:hypothetical protein
MQVVIQNKFVAMANQIICSVEQGGIINARFSGCRILGDQDRPKMKNEMFFLRKLKEYVK